MPEAADESIITSSMEAPSATTTTASKSRETVAKELFIFYVN